MSRAGELDFDEPLDALVAARPAAPAIRETSGDVIRYAELSRRVTTLRDALRDRGMTPGDQVLFCVRPGIDAVVLALAVAGAGGVIVPCDPGMGDALFAARIATLAPRWVVAESLLLTAASGGTVARALGWFGVRVAPIAQLSNVRFIRVGAPVPGGPPAVSVRALLTRRSAQLPRLSLDPALPALIEFTSGTTGAPKAVVHTRRSLAATLLAVRRSLDADEHSVVLSAALHLIVPALLAGAQVVIPHHAADARHTIREIDRSNVSHLFCVASECRRLADYCDAHRRRLPASLRLLMLGGAPVHPSLLQRVDAVREPHTRVVSIYGMTELLVVALVSLEEKLAYHGAGDLLGTPVEDVRVRVADTGELLVSGPALFDRYLGGVPVTEHATGDLVRHEAGRLVLLGRTKDMIIRGRTNIYPELYEPLIESLPGVRRCALVGHYREDIADEVVVLVVEPEPGVDGDELCTRLRRELSSGDSRMDAAARPDTIMAMTLPESGRGSKVDKSMVRALVRERFACA